MINLLIDINIKTIANRGLAWALKRQLKRWRLDIYTEFDECRYYALHYRPPRRQEFDISLKMPFQFQIDNNHTLVTSVVVDNDFEITYDHIREYFNKECGVFIKTNKAMVELYNKFCQFIYTIDNGNHKELSENIEILSNALNMHDIKLFKLLDSGYIYEP